jgi:hypothetical protein
MPQDHAQDSTPAWIRQQLAERGFRVTRTITFKQKYNWRWYGIYKRLENGKWRLVGFKWPTYLGAVEMVALLLPHARSGDVAITPYRRPVPEEDISPSRQQAAILGDGYRYKKPLYRWHKQPSGNVAGWERSHWKTGRPIGRPKLAVGDFAIATVRQELEQGMNGYPFEPTAASLRRRGPRREGERAARQQLALRIAELVDAGRRRAVIAAALDVSAATVDALAREGRS